MTKLVPFSAWGKEYFICGDLITEPMYNKISLSRTCPHATVIIDRKTWEKFKIACPSEAAATVAQK